MEYHIVSSGYLLSLNRSIHSCVVVTLFSMAFLKAHVISPVYTINSRDVVRSLHKIINYRVVISSFLLCVFQAKCI